MSARARWGMVAAVVALLVAAPFVVRALPVPSSHLTAVQVVERIRGARTLGYAGMVTTKGDIALPAPDSLAGLGAILGRDSTMRVWWQDPDTWRVAVLRPSGETDLVHQDDRLSRWVYESRQVTRVSEAPLRLPRANDLVPPVLARHVLEGARPGELSRLPTRRVAGRVGVGVRLVPRDPRSTVGRVDVWADEATGVPLRVDLYADRGPVALSAAFTHLDVGRPRATALAFTPPPGARVREDWLDDTAMDLAVDADRYDERVAPARLAGLPARGHGLGPVGLYGSGPTVLLAVPLRSGDAETLRRALRARGRDSCGDEGDAITSGPLSLFLTRRWFADDWLLAGTVTVDAMARTAAQLPAGVGDQASGLPTFTEPCPS